MSNLGHESMCLASESNKDCQNRVVQPALREDCHWLPQWMYVEGECEHVMRTESLTDDFRALMSEVGGVGAAELPMSDNARNVSACPIDASMFDAENEALIREVYAKDFELFNYSIALDRNAVAAASELKVESQQKAESAEAADPAAPAAPAPLPGVTPSTDSDDAADAPDAASSAQQEQKPVKKAQQAQQEQAQQVARARRRQQQQQQAPQQQQALQQALQQAH